MIDLDSPVESVLGEPKAKQAKRARRITEGLGLAHRRRPAPPLPAPLRRDRRADRASTTCTTGELLTVVGEIAESEVNTYLDRRTGRTAYRLDTALATDGPSLRMSFFAKQHSDRPTGRPAAAHRSAGAASSSGQVEHVPRRVAADQPADGAVRRRRRGDEAPGAAVARAIGAALPALPADQGRRVVGPPARDRLRPHRASTTCPTCSPTRSAATTTCSTLRTALDWIHAPDTWGQVDAGPAPLPVRGGAGHPAGAGRGAAPCCARSGARPRDGRRRACSRRSTSGCRSRSPPASGRSAPQIEADLAQPHPMNRLLQGEVGSGKTLVALRAMLRVVDSGGQAALLAPTEVLAQQHHRSITALLGDLGGRRHAGRRRGGHHGRAAHRLDDQGRSAPRRCSRLGERRGRHRRSAPTRCCEEHVQFADLGLVVVDEQHRFGVEQRAALTDKAGGAAARAGDDRDADPAHRRDDGLRRPRGLHADRAARPAAAPIQTNVVPLAEQPHWIDRVWAAGARGGRARATRPTSCARASPATSSSRARPTRPTTTSSRQPWRPRRRALSAVEDVVDELAHGSAGRPAGRPAARPAAAGREGPHDARLRGRRDRRAGRRRP